jgi:hypothetical protein
MLNTDCEYQSHQDSGQMRDVRVVKFYSNGAISDDIPVAGQAASYAEALEMVKPAGYTVTLENEAYDIGHIANPDGLDAYGIPGLM